VVLSHACGYVHALLTEKIEVLSKAERKKRRRGGE
jgi:hypothetical protein